MKKSKGAVTRTLTQLKLVGRQENDYVNGLCAGWMVLTSSLKPSCDILATKESKGNKRKTVCRRTSRAQNAAYI